MTKRETLQVTINQAFTSLYPRKSRQTLEETSSSFEVVNPLIQSVHSYSVDGSPRCDSTYVDSRPRLSAYFFNRGDQRRPAEEQTSSKAQGLCHNKRQSGTDHDEYTRRGVAMRTELVYGRGLRRDKVDAIPRGRLLYFYYQQTGKKIDEVDLNWAYRKVLQK
jgi:hypothetical protein